MRPPRVRSRLGIEWMLRLLFVAGASLLAPTATQAQSCAAGNNNSCMTVTFTPLRPTPSGEDFAAGVGVLGSFTVTVIKCGGPPCQLLVAAANQPSGGLRLRVGGAAPRTLSECPINLNGVTQPFLFFSPTIAQTNGPAVYTVWLCRPLSWDPAVTPLGTSSPEVRFRLFQN